MLFLGRLTGVKGCDHAIEATAHAARELGRKLALDVCGTGPREAALRGVAASSDVEVSFHGWVDGERKRELLSQAEALLLPSLWPEPFGMVGLEAGAHGVPCVAYRTGGIPDWLRPGQNGELAEGFDARALGRALARSLSNPDRYASLCRGALRVALEFSPERHLSQLLQLFANSCAVGGSVAAVSGLPGSA
jgi:glycosyltransferase involved in cell wall biosynthesis